MPKIKCLFFSIKYLFYFIYSVPQITFIIFLKFKVSCIIVYSHGQTSKWSKRQVNLKIVLFLWIYLFLMKASVLFEFQKVLIY